MWPFDTRLRAELAEVKAKLESVKADRERIRKERNQFLRDRDTQKAVARKAAEQYADLYDQFTATAIVNGCLTEDLTKARAELVTPATDWQAKYEAEKKRADRLQQQLDDALGMDRATKAGAGWEDRREQRMKYDTAASDEVAS